MTYDENGNRLTCFIDNLWEGLHDEGPCDAKATHHVEVLDRTHARVKRGLDGQPGPVPRTGQCRKHAEMFANAINARTK